MLYAGLDLSRKRLHFHLLDSGGVSVDVGAAPPDADACGRWPLGSAALACRSERRSSR
jgi:hypothetical protein